MATITEAYVSFETAKLLKEKGFDELCHAYYEDNGYFIKSHSSHAIRNITNPCFFGVAASTQQMAMRWLREVHNLHIVVFRYDNSAFPYIWYIFTHNGDKPHKANSYEEACEAAIKYCLKHLI